MLRRLALVLMLCVALPEAASAQSFQDQLIEQLTEQGYREFRISRTWLGRTRIVATSPRLKREIVFNPVTGVILRDYWVYVDRNGSDDNQDGYDLYDPEDDEIYDRDDDNSGPSDNSGSGSSDDEPEDDESDSSDSDDEPDEEDSSSESDVEPDKY